MDQPSCRIATVAAAASRGGAHVAAQRLHDALISAGHRSTYVCGLIEGQPANTLAATASMQQYIYKARAKIGRTIVGFCGAQGRGLESINVLPSGVVRRLTAGQFDIVHLHWVNNEFISVREIGRIRVPMVWTLHDMWAFCGTEHYVSDAAAYLGPPGTRPGRGPSRLALWNWERKRRYWAGLHPILVAPSKWIGDLAAGSRLLGHCRVEVVPYGLDLGRFAPRPNVVEAFNAPFRVAFGAAGGSADPRKGFDLFMPAMHRLALEFSDDRFELVFFGQASVPAFVRLPANVRVTSAGVIASEEEMASLLATADVFVAPSRQDNLPNTVLEATACGVPTVAFRIGGMPDMVDHLVSGYLATPYVPEDLAAGMAWVLRDPGRLRNLKQAARAKAEREFGSDRQANRILTIYEQAMRAGR